MGRSQDRKIALIQIAYELAVPVGGDEEHVDLIHAFSDGEDRVVSAASSASDRNRSGIVGSRRDRRTPPSYRLTPRGGA